MPEKSVNIDSSVTHAPAEGTTRRGLLYGAGLAGVAGVVAACGSDDDKDKKAEKKPGDQKPAGVLAMTSEIPVGSGKIFKDQQIVVTQPKQGEFKAFGIKCTHKGCPVDKVEGETIKCPCHGSVFKASDGSPVAGPAPKPLETKAIKVENNQIKLA